MRAAVCALLLAACSSSKTSVHVQISVATDATAIATASPATISVWGPTSRIVAGASLQGQLPGDVVVLVDDDLREVRVDVRIVTMGIVTAEGDGRVSVVPGAEARLAITVDAGALADTDGDGVPDDLDDCANEADPMQNGPCAHADLSSTVDMAMPDLAMSLCGNGVVDPGEACDDGTKNSDGASAIATCTTHCQRRAPCGTITGSTGVVVDPDTGHCYVAWPGPATFTAGEVDCLGRGGHLAAITSSAENTRVATLAGTTARWIGLVEVPTGQPNVWTTSETSSYSAYRPGAPTGAPASCVVTLPNAGGWEDRECGFAATGNLPASPMSTAGYVCETSCGNGILDLGEQCDPPSGSCTNTCRTIRPCTEAGAVSSAATGACYFAGTTPGAYGDALMSGCPTGTHLAAPSTPLETAAALKSITTDSWIAVRAVTQVGSFAYDAGSAKLDSTRYHGFVAPDPDATSAPACAAISKGDTRGDGWRDRDCASEYPPICERD